MNNFFTPIFRLTKHHPLPWVPLRAINVPIEPQQAFTSRLRCVALPPGYAHASDDPDFEPDGDAMGLIPGSDTGACAVKVVLSATRSMHIAMLLRHVQAFFNNGARKSPGANGGNSRACTVQRTCVHMEY